MAKVNFNEMVSVLIADHAPRAMTLADAVREIIAIPQKTRSLRTVILRDGPTMRTYGQVLALYARRDFPD